MEISVFQLFGLLAAGALIGWGANDLVTWWIAKELSNK